jgi:hypothetical protein
MCPTALAKARRLQLTQVRTSSVSSTGRIPSYVTEVLMVSLSSHVLISEWFLRTSAPLPHVFDSDGLFFVSDPIRSDILGFILPLPWRLLTRASEPASIVDCPGFLWILVQRLRWRHF